MEAPDVALNRFNNVQGDSRALTLEMLAVKTLGSGRQHEGRVQGIGFAQPSTLDEKAPLRTERQ